MKNLLIFALLSLAICERTFKIVDDHFEMDGKPFTYVSGSFHYFRQEPGKDYVNWENTIKKIANGGLNAVQTYVAWNLHEPRKGEFNFDGIANIVRFVQIAQKYNMYVILRPGPFICGEWDFGGLPYWLQREPGIKLRTSDPIYQKHVEDFYNVLLPLLRPYLYQNGGSIIMIQIENEYGFYPACDKAHLKWLLDLSKRLLRDDVVFFTVDSANDDTLKCGTLPEYIYPTIDFGVCDNVEEKFATQMRYAKRGPKVNSEFYSGWLDHWQEKHHKVDAHAIAKTLESMLRLNASVNFYMYYGGSNHHFFAGSNGDNNYFQADLTTYDYDAPLSEAGDMTEKWAIIRDTIAKFRPIAKWPVENDKARSYGSVAIAESVSMFDVMPAVASRCMADEKPLSFEALDTDFGYVHYKITTKGGTLKFQNKVHDRAYIIVDKVLIDVLQRDHEYAVVIPAGELDILIENQGRINFGSAIVEEKGPNGDVYLDGEVLKGFTMCVMPLKTVSSIPIAMKPSTEAFTFHHAVFNVDTVANTYLNPTGFKKGVAFVNGYNLGRYWTVGPQLTLFVPATLLKEGENELVLFEAEGNDGSLSVSFDDKPQIDNLYRCLFIKQTTSRPFRCGTRPRSSRRAPKRRSFRQCPRGSSATRRESGSAAPSDTRTSLPPAASRCSPPSPRRFRRSTRGLGSTAVTDGCRSVYRTGW